MADLVFNVAKGQLAHYASLPATNDALIVIALKASGIESDATLKDYDTVAAILAASNDEATNTGYARKTVTSAVTVTVDDTNDRVDIDMPDLVWTAVQTTGGAWSDLLVAYDPDTTGGDDTALIPLSLHDFSVTPDGNDVYATIASTGFMRAA